MPWMNMDTRPDPNRAPCGNCGGVEWENHETIIFENVSYRLCAEGWAAIRDILNDSGYQFRTETDEDRRAARATAMGI